VRLLQRTAPTIQRLCGLCSPSNAGTSSWCRWCVCEREPWGAGILPTWSGSSTPAAARTCMPCCPSRLLSDAPCSWSRTHDALPMSLRYWAPCTPRALTDCAMPPPSSTNMQPGGGDCCGRQLLLYPAHRSGQKTAVGPLTCISIIIILKTLTLLAFWPVPLTPSTKSPLSPALTLISPRHTHRYLCQTDHAAPCHHYQQQLTPAHIITAN
jgi:hypothetical protein